MKKPLPGDQFKRYEAPVSDALLMEDFPEFYEHLTATAYEDGGARVTSTLLIFVDNGVLKLCLNDRDNGRSAFFTATDLMSAIHAMESALRENTVDWRSKRQSGGDSMRVPW